MQVFGYIRFSFNGVSDTKQTQDLDYDERIGFLYSPKRMNLRFHLFENITLPSLRHQSSMNFKIYIMVSDVMPKIYHRRLQELVADIPQIEVASSSMDELDVFQEDLMMRHTAPASHNTIHFRLDDDDALAVDAVERLEKAANALEHGAIYTNPRGLMLMSDKNDGALLRKYEKYIAIGWAKVIGPGQIYRSIFRFSHRMATERFPTLIYANTPAFIHTLHETSDTAKMQGKKFSYAYDFDPEYSTAEGIEQIRKEVSTYFPWTTREKLLSIIQSNP